MQENSISSVREVFAQMSTDQLDQLLKRELHTEPPNTDVIRLILDILYQREKDMPVELTPEMEQAWETYCRKLEAISAREKRRRCAGIWMKRALSAVAVLALLVMVVPQPAEAESLWDRLVRWTENFVEFFSPEDNDYRIVEYEFKTQHPGLQQVYETVVEMGVEDPVVPMWIPEGYELAECKLEITPRKNRLIASFMQKDVVLIYEIQEYHKNVAHQFYRNDRLAESYEINGITHYIISNSDTCTVIWMRDNIECSLSIDCQEGTLKDILKSIYEWEDT